MSLRNKCFCVFICLAMILSLSCNKSETVSSGKNALEVEKKKGPVIGFSIDTLAIERWQRDLDVFMGEAKELGADVIVQNAGNSVDEQNRQLLYLAGKNVDVIVIVAKDGVLLADTIDKILAKGIPVISYDRLILNAPINLYITIDSEQVGYLMGRGMLARTPIKKWCCILGPQEDYNMAMIMKGLEKSIVNTGVLLDSTYYIDGWNYDLSHQLMVNMITEDKVPNVVVCGNDAVADSVILALQTYKPGKHVFICGQDADIAACQNIVHGLQDFTIYKPITELAKKAAQYAVLLANGKDIAEGPETLTTIDNGYGQIPALMLAPELVDKNNIDEVVIESGFHTSGEVYRD